MDDLDATVAGLSALSQEIRLLAFRALMEAGADGLAAGDISRAIDIAPNKLSGHLSILTAAGLVSVQRVGRSLIYRAEIPRISGLVSALVETCCHGHPEVCGAVATAAPARA